MKPEREPVGVAPSQELAHLRLLHLCRQPRCRLGRWRIRFGLETLVSAEILTRRRLAGIPARFICGRAGTLGSGSLAGRGSVSPGAGGTPGIWCHAVDSG